MSQADTQIATGKSGTDYRTQDNAGKKALLNHHKGSSAPSYKEAGVFWVDDTSTPWVLKCYDGTDWISLGTINATTNLFTPYVGASLAGSMAIQAAGAVAITGGSVTGITDISIADGGTGASTAAAAFTALKQAATTAATGVVELATNTEAVTGTDTSRAVTPAGLSAAIAANASSDYELLSVQTASDSATLDFTSVITSDYTNYVFVIEDLRPASDSVQLYMRTSTNNGSSYDAGSSDYFTSIEQRILSGSAASTVFQVNNSSESGIRLVTTNTDSDEIGNASAEGVSGTVNLIKPLGTTRRKAIYGEMQWQDRGGDENFTRFIGSRNATADIDAARFFFSSGNITSGSIKLYGRKGA